MAQVKHRTRLEYLDTEIASVETLLYQLRHNRGRWPKKWCSGMIRHYEGRHQKLRADRSRALKVQTTKGSRSPK